MNTSHKADAITLDCAILRAGSSEIALAIAAREGRHPVQFLPSEARLAWRCADGCTETLPADTPENDVRLLLREVERHGLLVAEVQDQDHLQPHRDLGDPEYWLLTPGGEADDGFGGA